jgi:hypothetical protein
VICCPAIYISCFRLLFFLFLGLGVLNTIRGF